MMIMMMVVGMMMMAVIARWCPLLSVDPCIGRHTPYKTLSQKDDDAKKCNLSLSLKDKYIWRTPSNDNPRGVVKFLTFLTIENIETLQP